MQHSLGGVELLFPLLEQVDIPIKPREHSGPPDEQQEEVEEKEEGVEKKVKEGSTTVKLPSVTSDSSVLSFIPLQKTDWFKGTHIYTITLFLKIPFYLLSVHVSLSLSLSPSLSLLLPPSSVTTLPSPPLPPFLPLPSLHLSLPSSTLSLYIYLLLPSPHTPSFYSLSFSLLAHAESEKVASFLCLLLAMLDGSSVKFLSFLVLGEWIIYYLAYT